jgi:hypothetical protein
MARPCRAKLIRTAASLSHREQGARRRNYFATDALQVIRLTLAFGDRPVDRGIAHRQ